MMLFLYSIRFWLLRISGSCSLPIGFWLLHSFTSYSSVSLIFWVLCSIYMSLSVLYPIDTRLWVPFSIYEFIASASHRPQGCWFCTHCVCGRRAAGVRRAAGRTLRCTRPVAPGWAPRASWCRRRPPGRSDRPPGSARPESVPGSRSASSCSSARPHRRWSGGAGGRGRSGVQGRRGEDDEFACSGTGLDLDEQEAVGDVVNHVSVHAANAIMHVRTVCR